MATETTLVPGAAEEWRDFDNADYDPQAKIGGDEDLLGAFLADRDADNPFGVMIQADPGEAIDPTLVKRLASMQIPTRVRRAARDEHKAAGGKKKKPKSKD
jgi:hypothetical protein